MAERDNNSSNLNSSKKNESRLGQSPLSSEKKNRSKKAVDSPSTGTLPKPMKYKPKSPTPAKEKKVSSPEEESESEGTSREFQPKVTVISFGSKKNKSTRRASKAPPAIPQPDPECFNLTVETIMTGSTPLVLSVTKSKTIRNVKSLIRAKIKAKNFGIYLNNKELAPEDSTLESNGIVADTKVRLHVKTQSGTSDQEDINSLIRLTKSMNDLKNIIHSLPSKESKSKDRGKTTPRTKEVIEPEKKAEEDQRSREKMAKLREKFAQRNGKTTEKKKSKKKSRRDGGIAGQYALPQQNATKTSDPTNNSGDESSDREKIKSSTSTGSVISIFEPSLDLGQGPVTNKELLLYFDLPESEDRVQFLAKELFEPPANQEKLEEIRNEFRTFRCAHCRTRLPLILREMPCRCSKVYCQAHRSPFKHCCAVDLKKVDRIKLEKDVPKSNPVSRKNSDEEIQPPKSSSKKLM